MPRPVSLFTGQWADLPLEDLAPEGRRVRLRRPRTGLLGRPLRRAGARSRTAPTARQRWELLSDHGLELPSRSATTSSARPCATHRRAPPGDPARRASGATAIPRACAAARAQEMKDTAKRRARFFDAAPAARARRAWRAPAAAWSTASPAARIWHLLYAFPPAPPGAIEKGYADFAERWKPILDAFDEAGRELRARGAPDRDRLRHRLGPARARGASDDHPRFGFNFDPSHLGYQGVDYVGFLREFGARIFHVHMKDVWWSRRRRASACSAGTRTSATRRPLLGLPLARAAGASTSRASCAR